MIKGKGDRDLVSEGLWRELRKLEPEAMAGSSCCGMVRLAMAHGTRMVGFTINRGKGSDMFAVPLRYCPVCGRRL